MKAASYSSAAIEQLKQRGQLFGAAFAKILSLMMHSPAHKDLDLSDLMRLVAPPRLGFSTDKDGSVRLAADEWQSGDMLRMIDAAGHPAIVPPFPQEFVATHFRSQHPEMWIMGNEGVAKALFVGLDGLEQESRS